MKKSIVAFLFSAVTFVAQAQNSILWEVTGNGLESPSYLLGTLKFIGVKEYIFPKEFKEKMDKCKIFAIEDQVDHKAQMEINKALHLPKGKSLATELSPEDYATLVAFMEKEFHIPQAKFEKDLGKLIPLALSINMTRMALGEDVKYYDIELLLTAKKEKLKTYSLEPIKREAEAIQSFPMEEQKKALMESVKNFEDQKNDYKQLEAAFDANDLDRIFSLTLHPTEDHPDFVEVFYTKRNLEWMPKIERMMRDKPAFITVGITHLEGDQGLLALLRAKGYTLTPVPLSR